MLTVQSRTHSWVEQTEDLWSVLFKMLHGLLGETSYLG